MKNLISLTLLILLLGQCELFEPKKNQDDKPSYQLTQDPTNYGAGLLQIAQLYNTDPVKYFAEHGFRRLVLQFQILNASKQDGMQVFASLLDSFDQNGAQQAKTQPQWNAAFINKMNEVSATPIKNQWMHAMLFFATDLNNRLLRNPGDAGIGQLYGFIGEGIRRAIKSGYLQKIAPPSIPGPANTVIQYNEFCICEMFNPVSCDTKSDTSQSTDSVKKVKWWKISEPFNTTHQGKCAALSTGLCLHKLGKIDSMCDGKTWDGISKGIKALKKGGAFNENINAFFESQGFAASKTTSISEVSNALNRGCDAKLVYHDGSIIGGKQHIEYITHVNVASAADNYGVVHTISWGDSANVLYKNGKFSGKSDGSQYEGEEFLAGSGSSHFLIYCPK
ncbi:MAG: hypothetical protein JNL57_11475 [Bacteroidetes bacterium]|nr:hypothetical protein [Bacteroidota bacterium]